jgi:hypothetical protein
LESSRQNRLGQEEADPEVTESTMSQESLWLWDRDSSGAQEGFGLVFADGNRNQRTCVGQQTEWTRSVCNKLLTAVVNWRELHRVNCNQEL